LNVTGREEHISKIERFVRTVKERCRAVYSTLPFSRFSPRMIIEMVNAAAFRLNAFLYLRGVSSVLSTIISGQTISYRRHCSYSFGEYVQTNEEHGNSMSPRTVGAIALRHSGNSQESWMFMSLQSGRVVVGNHATKLPMPDEVTTRVEQIEENDVDDESFTPELGEYFDDDSSEDDNDSMPDEGDNIDKDDLDEHEGDNIDEDNPDKPEMTVLIEDESGHEDEQHLDNSDDEAIDYDGDEGAAQPKDEDGNGSQDSQGGLVNQGVMAGGSSTSRCGIR
jgi:hypothetical protein